MFHLGLFFAFFTLGLGFPDEFEFAHPAIVPEPQEKFPFNRKFEGEKRLDRLLPNFIAVHYDLWIKPYFPAPGVTFDQSRNLTFDGIATITVQATQDSSQFILNQYNLNISAYNVVRSDGQSIPIHSFYTDNDQQLVYLTPRSVGIQSGAVYNITLNYTGVINYYQEGGLFYTYYIDQSGQRNWMVATQMEPSDARRVFPGLDEPAYKATFDVTIVYPTQLVVLGNMMETTPTDAGNGYSQMTFPTTPKMSTYLIAFAIGPFVSQTVINEAFTEVRAWGWPGTEDYLKFAAVTSGNCLYQMGEYTGIRFPLSKSDQLGLPEFPAGAMENWGLVIYKYQYIAFNPTTMTTFDMQEAMKVMCHELAHQWFGDLVTPKWWDDIFLNEGFADYFMRFAQEQFYTDQAQFLDALHVRAELQYALQTDAGPNSHPLVDPNGPRFDLITYRKGASMLRMLSDVLGADVFRRGLQDYLQAFQYANSDHEDLFAALTKQAQSAGLVDWCNRPFNVSVFMAPYANQVNFPLINFNNNQINSYATFTQAPFSDPSTLPTSTWNYSWPVPLRTLRYVNSSYVLQWMKPDYDNCKTAESQFTEHFEVAGITTALYGRIIYDDIGFDRLIKQIRDNQISNQVYITLLADELAQIPRLQQANQPFSYSRFLTLCKTIFNTFGFTAHPSFSVADMAYPNLEYIASHFRDHMDAPFIKMMYTAMFQNTYDFLKWEDTGDWDTDSFSEQFLPLAVRLGMGDSANRTLSMFANVKAACNTSSNGTAWCNPYSTNFRRAIYCGAAQYAPSTSDFFYHLITFYNAEVVTNPYFYQEYLALLEGMTCTQTYPTLRTTIKLFLSSPLNPNTIFGWFFTNPAASDALARYLNETSQAVLAYRGLDAYLNAMTYNWRSEKRLNQLLAIQSGLQLTDAQAQVFTKYIVRTQNQAGFESRYLVKISNWMYDNLVAIGHTPWRAKVDGSIVPNSYDLLLQPFIPGGAQYQFYQNMTFSATATMNFDVKSPIQTIQMNAHRILINTISVFLPNKVITVDTGIIKDYQNAMLYIPIPGGLEIGSYLLQITYQGFVISRPSDGVDLNWNYYEFDGKQGWIFTTDFEGGPSVRSLLPCIDEPAYKANFTVRVIHPADMTAISNNLDTGMKMLSNGWAQTNFVATPKMSSYLLAICVGHFSSIAKVSDTGVLVRMFSWTGMEQYGEFGLKVIAGTLDFMAIYFNQPYALPKLDTMALPQYSNGADAMENWGLIIGAYQYFLVDADYATTHQLAEVAETASHETVHQWFGDLVTLDWWNDIFLNEAFAQYWYANGINYTFPDQEDYAIEYNRYDVNSIALEIDCDPVEAKPVITDIPPVFSDEPYYKGSALLNLLSNVLTPATLQKGLRNYIQTYKYGNANATDLWNALSQAAQADGKTDWNGNPLDVASFMGPYTLQTSFPILKLSSNDGATVTYQQSACVTGTQTWNIPLFSQTPNGETFNWFTGANGNSPAWNHPVGSPYQVDNTRSSSFARVQYDNKTWANLLTQLYSDPSVFATATRASILDDAAFFTSTYDFDITQWMDLSLYLRQETALAPWRQAIPMLQMLLSNFRYSQDYDNVKNYVLNITANAFGQYGWRTSNKWTEKFRDLTELTCLAGSFTCAAVANQNFQSFIVSCKQSNVGTAKCTNVSPDLRRTMYCYGLKQNPDNELTIERLYNYFVNNATYFERDKTNLLRSLGCVQDPNTQQRLIRQTLRGDFPPRLLGYIALGDSDGYALFNYFTSNLQEVSLSTVSFQTYVNAMVINWSTSEQMNKLMDFEVQPVFKILPPDQTLIYVEAVSDVGIQVAWQERNSDNILGWIQRNIGAVN